MRLIALLACLLSPVHAAAPKVALVTGATGGLGLETSVALARQGYTVVMAARDAERGQAAAAEAAARSGGKTEFLQLDLGSAESIRAAADEIRGRYPALSVLINNAGVLNAKRRETADGVEETFAVSHLGHFDLTRRLLPALAAGAPSRIVNVTSVAHRQARWDWSDPQLRRGWGGVRAYGNAKLALIWLTRELARRLPAGVTANAVHPGGAATGIFRAWPRPLRWLLGLWLGSAEEGAAPIVRAATAPQLSGVSGRYFERFDEKAPSAAARDDGAARRLWDYSASLRPE